MKLFHENYRLPYFFVTVTTLLPNEAFVDSVYSVYIYISGDIDARIERKIRQ